MQIWDAEGRLVELFDGRSARFDPPPVQGVQICVADGVDRFLERAVDALIAPQLERARSEADGTVTTRVAGFRSELPFRLVKSS
jgi:hypothetical protein